MIRIALAFKGLPVFNVDENTTQIGTEGTCGFFYFLWTGHMIFTPFSMVFPGKTNLDIWAKNVCERRIYRKLVMSDSIVRRIQTGHAVSFNTENSSCTSSCLGCLSGGRMMPG
jgi:hypothetical protein